MLALKAFGLIKTLMLLLMLLMPLMMMMMMMMKSLHFTCRYPVTLSEAGVCVKVITSVVGDTQVWLIGTPADLQTSNQEPKPPLFSEITRKFQRVTERIPLGETLLPEELPALTSLFAVSVLSQSMCESRSPCLKLES